MGEADGERDAVRKPSAEREAVDGKGAKVDAIHFKADNNGVVSGDADDAAKGASCNTAVPDDADVEMTDADGGEFAANGEDGAASGESGGKKRVGGFSRRGRKSKSGESTRNGKDEEKEGTEEEEEGKEGEKEGNEGTEGKEEEDEEDAGVAKNNSVKSGDEAEKVAKASSAKPAGNQGVRPGYSSKHGAAKGRKDGHGESVEKMHQVADRPTSAQVSKLAAQDSLGGGKASGEAIGGESRDAGTDAAPAPARDAAAAVVKSESIPSEPRDQQRLDALLSAGYVARGKELLFEIKSSQYLAKVAPDGGVKYMKKASGPSGKVTAEIFSGPVQWAQMMTKKHNTKRGARSKYRGKASADGWTDVFYERGASLDSLRRDMIADSTVSRDLRVKALLDGEVFEDMLAYREGTAVGSKRRRPASPADAGSASISKRARSNKESGHEAGGGRGDKRSGREGSGGSSPRQLKVAEEQHGIEDDPAAVEAVAVAAAAEKEEAVSRARRTTRLAAGKIKLVDYKAADIVKREGSGGKDGEDRVHDSLVRRSSSRVRSGKFLLSSSGRDDSVKDVDHNGSGSSSRGAGRVLEKFKDMKKFEQGEQGSGGKGGQRDGVALVKANLVHDGKDALKSAPREVKAETGEAAPEGSVDQKVGRVATGGEGGNEEDLVDDGSLASREKVSGSRNGSDADSKDDVEEESPRARESSGHSSASPGRGKEVSGDADGGETEEGNGEEEENEEEEEKDEEEGSERISPEPEMDNEMEEESDKSPGQPDDGTGDMSNRRTRPRRSATRGSSDESAVGSAAGSVAVTRGLKRKSSSVSPPSDNIRMIDAEDDDEDLTAELNDLIGDGDDEPRDEDGWSVPELHIVGGAVKSSASINPVSVMAAASKISAATGTTFERTQDELEVYLQAAGSVIRELCPRSSSTASTEGGVRINDMLAFIARELWRLQSDVPRPAGEMAGKIRKEARWRSAIEKNRRKAKRELEEARAKLEGEMESRRRIELEMSYHQLRYGELHRAADRERCKRRRVEAEIELYKRRDVDCKERIEQVKSLTSQLRGDQMSAGVAEEHAAVDVAAVGVTATNSSSTGAAAKAVAAAVAKDMAMKVDTNVASNIAEKSGTAIAGASATDGNGKSTERETHEGKGGNGNHGLVNDGAASRIISPEDSAAENAQEVFRLRSLIMSYEAEAASNQRASEIEHLRVTALGDVKSRLENELYIQRSGVYNQQSANIETSNGGLTASASKKSGQSSSPAVPAATIGPSIETSGASPSKGGRDGSRPVSRRKGFPVRSPHS